MALLLQFHPKALISNEIQKLEANPNVALIHVTNTLAPLHRNATPTIVAPMVKHYADHDAKATLKGCATNLATIGLFHEIKTMMEVSKLIEGKTVLVVTYTANMLTKFHLRTLLSWFFEEQGIEWQFVSFNNAQQGIIRNVHSQVNERFNFVTFLEDHNDIVLNKEGSNNKITLTSGSGSNPTFKSKNSAKGIKSVTEETKAETEVVEEPTTAEEKAKSNIVVTEEEKVVDSNVTEKVTEESVE